MNTQPNPTLPERTDTPTRIQFAVDALPQKSPLVRDMAANITRDIWDEDHHTRYAIVVDMEPQLVGIPYFKVLDITGKTSVREATRGICLSFTEPKIIELRGGLPELQLTRSLGELINKALQQKCRIYPGHTNWEAAICYYNTCHSGLNDVFFEDVTRAVIDIDPQRYTHCLPIDLPPPDYTALAVPPTRERIAVFNPPWAMEEIHEENELSAESFIGYLPDADGKPEYYIGFSPESADAGFLDILVYNNVEPEKATACVSLYMNSISYFAHEDYPLLKVTRELGLRLNRFLQSPSREFPHLTHWQALLERYNLYLGTTEDTELSFHMLTEEMKDNHPFEYFSCLPLSTEMPDYTMIEALETEGACLVARNFDSNFSLLVRARANDKEPAYFELYNDADPGCATRMARLAFKTPEYVSSPDAPPFWILNDREKEQLMALLTIRRRGYKVKKKSKLTNWQYAIALWNVRQGFIDTPEDALNLTDADCTPQLNHVAHPLPLSLPMPDYTRLREK